MMTRLGARDTPCSSVAGGSRLADEVSRVRKGLAHWLILRLSGKGWIVVGAQDESALAEWDFHIDPLYRQMPPC